MANVPNVPGVPPLASFAATSVGLLVADATGLPFGTGLPVWGVFLHGIPVPVFPVANSTISVEFKRDYSVSDYPVEPPSTGTNLLAGVPGLASILGGPLSFQSYDKVQLPFDLRVEIASGNTPIARQALLTLVDLVSNTTLLYDVVTPERIYTNCNMVHYEYRRAADSGLGMIVIDMWFREIRQSSQSLQFGNTLNPQDAGQQAVGAVQPQSVTPSFQSIASGWT